MECGRGLAHAALVTLLKSLVEAQLALGGVCEPRAFLSGACCAGGLLRRFGGSQQMLLALNGERESAAVVYKASLGDTCSAIPDFP